MDEQRKLGIILELAESLGIEVRLAPADMDSPEHPGGAVISLRGRDILFLNATASVEDQIRAVAPAVRGKADLDAMFLPPEIREAIEAARQPR